MSDSSTDRDKTDDGGDSHRGPLNEMQKQTNLATKVEPLFSAGRFDEAEKLILSTPKNSRSDWNYYVLLARVWSAQDRPREAEEAFRHAAAVAPMRAIPQWRLAEFLLRHGDLREAESVARRAVTIDPNTHSFHSTLGAVLVRQCFYEQAYKSIRRAIRLNPKHPQPRIVLAELYSAQKKSRRAESALNKARKLAPNSQQILWALCKLYEDQGRTEKAMACVKRIISLDPANPKVQVLVANQCKKLGRLEEAEQALRAALALRPLAATYNSLSQVLMARSRRTDALAALTEACRLDPDNKAYQSRLAKMTSGSGDDDPESPIKATGPASSDDTRPPSTSPIGRWRMILEALIRR